MTRNSTGVHRLRLISKVPEIEDLQKTLQAANAKKGIPVQLPFVDTEKDKAYVLSVLTGRQSSNTPEWTLSTGVGSMLSVLWIHESGDLHMIDALVRSQVTGVAQVAEGGLIQSDAFSSLPALFGSQDEEVDEKPNGRNKSNEKTRELEKPSARSTRTQDELDRINGSGPHESLKLEGDLEKVDLVGILQSIMVSKMSGKLQVRNHADSVSIYLKDGMPIHAHGQEGSGDQVLLDTFTWETGVFEFLPSERTVERTIQKRMELLLMEGCALLDQHKKLKELGFVLTSYILPKNPNLSEQSFDDKVASGMVFDLKAQKRFYLSFMDGKTRLIDLLRVNPMPRTVWVPIVFNLLQLDMITLSDRPSLMAKVNALETGTRDEAAIASGHSVLYRADTGIMNYPILLSLLEMEFERFEYTRQPFSLIILETVEESPQGISPASSQHIKELGIRINELKRPFDLFGHYRAFAYALVLPYTNLTGAIAFSKQLVDTVTATQFETLSKDVRVRLACGIASAPEDCLVLDQLIAAAEAAKQACKKTGVPVTAFRNMSV